MLKTNKCLMLAHIKSAEMGALKYILNLNCNLIYNSIIEKYNLYAPKIIHNGIEYITDNENHEYVFTGNIFECYYFMVSYEKYKNITVEHII